MCSSFVVGKSVRHKRETNTMRASTSPKRISVVVTQNAVARRTTKTPKRKTRFLLLSSSSSLEKREDENKNTFACWSNHPQDGENIVKEVVKNKLYVCERQFLWNTIDVGGRMAVVKLQNGELWVHSPIDLDEETKKEIEKLGEVKHIVSPNYEHLKYAKMWKRAYPNATLWGCPGLKEKKRGEIPYDKDLGDVKEEWKDEWLNEFEMVHWDCESLFSKPFFNEVSFAHKESKCLMVTDVYWNYPDGEGMDEKLYTFKEKGWKFLMDVIYLPIYKNVLCFGEEKKKKLRARVEDVERLDFNTIVPCHGTIVKDGDVKNTLRKHLL